MALINSRFKSAITEREQKLTTERKALLNTIADTMNKAMRENAEIVVKFVCTHNSRRSQTAEFVLDILARDRGINLTALSAGTEHTAFNPAMVQAIESWGFPLTKYGQEPNPLYIYSINHDDLYYYSKVYDEELIEYKNQIIITVCGDANENCPVIPGSYARHHLGFKDPKASDGTPDQKAVYADKVVEIGAEMLYLINQLN